MLGRALVSAYASRGVARRQFRRRKRAAPTQPHMIYQGDCLSVLKGLPDNSVQCCVTSPPYWALRDYGVPPTIWGGLKYCAHTFVAEPKAEGYLGKKKWQHSMTNAPNDNGRGEAQTSKRARSREDGGWTQVTQGETCSRCGAWRGCLGLEPTPALYIAHLVLVFTEVRRVLRKDGTLWLNIGDCYATGGGRVGEHPGGGKQGENWRLRGLMTPPNGMPIAGLKPKDLCMIPARVALALQASGWYVRSDIVWAKTNPMPESTRDRPTKSHEYIFLLTKRENYFYDSDAIRERDGGKSSGNKARKFRQQHGGLDGDRRHQGFAVPWTAGGGRNRRSVWTFPTTPFKGAHFAVFPKRLVDPCIRAGTSEHGCCSVCRAPFKRIIAKGKPLLDQQLACGGDERGEYHGQATKAYAGTGAQDPSATKARILDGMRERITVGWKPTCRHTLRTIEPCTVLDPFAGACTTGIVAQQLGREFVGIELGAQYVEMGEKRMAEASA